MASRKPKAKPANRQSVRHPSHNHPLRVFKAKEEDEAACSGCELELIGQAFKCIESDCDYFLHKSCFDLPSETHHKSHQDHPLTLLHSPPDERSVYTCDACDQYGSGFTYHCSNCNYNLHVGCTFIPETIDREDHEHPLTLLYCTPCKGHEDTIFTCSVCEETISEDLWMYYCKECDYGTHVHSCATYEDQESDEEEEEEDQDEDEGGEASSPASRIKSLMKARDEMAAMQLEARIENDARNAALDLWDDPKRRYYW
ncbi:PREDICTED: uncharacterized protein LOC104725107 [Camelina sativa]|uniref:Uncharacterized protein LOC104725107 n=1 Tax=Camelina sativa TaxID=90675 RepID=A0ABM0UJD5_CAMSA|nr:PREDICTED: uncharacterized protein LOC104725107 [Camelina sativa]